MGTRSQLLSWLRKSNQNKPMKKSKQLPRITHDHGPILIIMRQTSPKYWILTTKELKREREEEEKREKEDLYQSLFFGFLNHIKIFDTKKVPLPINSLIFLKVFFIWWKKIHILLQIMSRFRINSSPELAAPSTSEQYYDDSALEGKSCYKHVINLFIIPFSIFFILMCRI